LSEFKLDGTVHLGFHHFEALAQLLKKETGKKMES
jgi:hypothetical protein